MRLSVQVIFFIIGFSAAMAYASTDVNPCIVDTDAFNSQPDRSCFHYKLATLINPTINLIGAKPNEYFCKADIIAHDIHGRNLVTKYTVQWGPMLGHPLAYQCEKTLPTVHTIL